MKIGILTYHRANNYGAFLQAYGLCSRLNEEQDIEAEIIDFHMDKEIKEFDERKKSIIYKILKFDNYKFLKKRREIFKQTIQYQNLSTEYLHSDNIDDFEKFINNKYDVIIVGSDELWKLDGYRGFPTPYWLPCNLNCIKASYAVSSRTNLNSISEQNINLVKKFLNDFKIISVRDEITYNEFSKILSKQQKIYINADPSFLYDYKSNRKNGRKKLIKKLNLNCNKKIVLIMTENKKAAQIIRKQFKNKYQLVSIFHWHYGFKNIADLTPFEWIDAISGVDFVFSSYFHGICFSIINETPFLAIGTSLGKDSKILDILKNTENENRYISLKQLKHDNSLLINLVENLQNKPKNKKYIKKAREEFKDYINLIRNIYKKK